MPLRNGRATPKERKFAQVFAATGDRMYSAAKAGYRHPQENSSLALARPAVQAEIARIQTERLFSEGLPAAVGHLIACVQDVKAPHNARNQAAKIILDRTLGAEDAGKHKDPAEMSAEELDTMINNLKRVMSERAVKIIEVEPVEAGIFD